MNGSSKQKMRLALLTLGFLIIGFIFPWWSIVFVGLAAGATHSRALNLNIAKFKSPFLEAFLSCSLSWTLLAFYFDARSGFHLSRRVGGLLMLPWPVLPIVAIAILGGLIAGLSSAASSSLLAALRARHHGA